MERGYQLAKYLSCCAASQCAETHICSRRYRRPTFFGVIGSTALVACRDARCRMVTRQSVRMIFLGYTLLHQQRSISPASAAPKVCIPNEALPSFCTFPTRAMKNLLTCHHNLCTTQVLLTLTVDFRACTAGFLGDYSSLPNFSTPSHFVLFPRNRKNLVIGLPKPERLHAPNAGGRVGARIGPKPSPSRSARFSSVHGPWSARQVVNLRIEFELEPFTVRVFVHTMGLLLQLICF